MSSAPNVLWLITDDTGFDMLGHTGGPKLTPNIDAIAAQGIRCTNFHTASAACCPSRFSYLTGMYPGRCTAPRFRGEHPVDQFYRVGFDIDLMPPTPNVGSMLHDAGYFTGYVGKYHTGTPRETFHGHRYSPDDDPRDAVVAEKLQADYNAMQSQLYSNGFDYAEAMAWDNVDFRPIESMQYHNLEWHTDAALKFLDQAQMRQQPFFLKMATTVFHGPHHVRSLEREGLEIEPGLLDAPLNVQPSRQSVFDRLRQAGVDVTHRSAGAVWVDDAFGAVLHRLDELGMADNTIVIYSTDHGPGTSNSKFTCYQGGVHIPFCIKWPGRIAAGGVCDAMMQNIDVLPTLLDMIGLTPPPNARFDGLSRWRQLQGGLDDRQSLYFEWGRLRAVRTNRYKYITLRYTPAEIEAMQRSAVREDDLPAFLPYNMWREGDFPMHMHACYWDSDQLYDLVADPNEQVNLADDPAYASTCEQMRERLRSYLDDFDHPYPLQPDPFQATSDYRRLTQRNLQDRSIYEAYYYKEHAY